VNPLNLINLFKFKRMTTRDRIIEIALAEVGTRETPPGLNQVKYNDWFYGRPVKDTEKYKYYWCMAYVSWVYAQALKPLYGGDYPRGFCSVPNCLKHYRKMGEITTDPQPGDIVIYDWQQRPDKSNVFNADHVGIFVKWVEPGKVFQAVEGNTSDSNAGSQSNGDGVFVRTRDARFVMEFISPKTLSA
jgi:hypothetical protein